MNKFTFFYPCIHSGRQNVGLTDEDLHFVKTAKYMHYTDKNLYNAQNNKSLIQTYSDIGSVEQWLAVFGD